MKENDYKKVAGNKYLIDYKTNFSEVYDNNKNVLKNELDLEKII